MITLRQRIFITISVVVGLLIVFLLLYYFVFKTESRPRQILDSFLGVSSPTSDETGSTSGQDAENIIPVFGEYSPEVYAKQLARIFVERFATFSNQNNNQHIEDVWEMSTPLMQKWLETQKLSPALIYQGQTTRVIASRTLSFTNNEVVVLVETQQELEQNNEKQVVQRSGRVELVKVGEDWKVDGFYWNR